MIFLGAQLLVILMRKLTDKWAVWTTNIKWRQGLNGPWEPSNPMILENILLIIPSLSLTYNGALKHYAPK